MKWWFLTTLKCPFPGWNSLFSFVALCQLECAKPLYWRVRMGIRATLYVVSSFCISVCSGDIHLIPSLAPDWPLIALLLGLAMPFPTTETKQLNLLQWFHFTAVETNTPNAVIWLAFGIIFYFSAQSKFSTVISLFSAQPKKIITTLYSWGSNVIEVINTENSRNLKWHPCIFGTQQRNVSRCLLLYVE